MRTRAQVVLLVLGQALAGCGSSPAPLALHPTILDVEVKGSQLVINETNVPVPGT